MSSPCNGTDWTPEQRAAVARVEILRMQRAFRHYPSTLSGNPIPPALRGWRLVAVIIGWCAAMAGSLWIAGLSP